MSQDKSKQKMEDELELIQFDNRPKRLGLGALLFFMFQKEAPFKGSSVDEVCSNTLRQNPEELRSNLTLNSAYHELPHFQNQL